MSGHRFFIENRPRSRAGRTFRPKIDLAHERGALSGKKTDRAHERGLLYGLFQHPAHERGALSRPPVPSAPVRGALFPLRQAIAR